jgi:anti-sigma factor RsiW
MTTGLNMNDWELISAYIDGQLSSHEKFQLEQRFLTDPDLLSVYKSLVRTRIILKEARRVKRRRNFYLTRQMIPSNNWLKLIPVLNFSSAAAAVLAIVLFIADIFPSAVLVNKAVVVSDSAPQVSAPRPAAAPQAAGEPEIISTPASVENAFKNEGTGAGAGGGPPQVTQLPAAKLPANVAPEEAPAEPFSPTGETIPLPELSVQVAPESADMAVPSMKAAPSEPLTQAEALPVEATSAVEELPQPEGSTVESVQQNSLTLIPEGAPQTGFAGEPTNVEVEGTENSPTLVPFPTATQQIIANLEQNPPDEPGVDQREMAAEKPSDQQIPPSVELAENLVKVSWIALLGISVLLSLLSFYIKNKSAQ